MATIVDLIAASKEFGVFDFYLPFLILFSITFGVLNKVKIFGEPKERAIRNIHVILALAISLFAMIYTPIGITLSQFLANLFTGTMIVVVTLLMIAIMGAIVIPTAGIKIDVGKKLAYFVVFLIVAIGIAVFISSGGAAFFPGLVFAPISEIPIVLFPGLTMQDLALLSLVVLTGLIIYWFTKEPKELTPEQKAKVKQELIEEAEAARRAAGGGR